MEEGTMYHNKGDQTALLGSWSKKSADGEREYF